MSDARALELSYPLRTVVRLTGISPDLLRAWEKRYGVVVPLRTPGGTRRYTAADLERLGLVKAAVDMGHRIGEVAGLDDEALRERIGRAGVAQNGRSPDDRFDEVLGALDRLEAGEAQRLLSQQLSILGPSHFARDFALPLVREIGERWANGRMGIASEHLATGILRSMLGTALHPTVVSRRGPVIVFATPPGERHELGLQMAALTAVGAGGNVVYLGAELPVEDLIAAVSASGCAAIALSVITIPTQTADHYLAEARRVLRGSVRLWVGGHGARQLRAIEGVDRIESLDELERHVALLAIENPQGEIR